MKVKITLDTMTSAREFVKTTSKLDGKITITDGNGLCVNAKSLMGALYALEFEELWCESENDIYSQISRFITN
jgi:hypothetical protein